MSDPVYLHAASRTMSYGYQPKDYGKDNMKQRLSQLLSIPANDLLRRVPVPIDSIFVSSQFADKSGAEELVVNQLVDSLSISDHQGKQYRLAGVTCVRIETATNGLTALKLALDHIHAHSGDTVLVIGGEKLTPAEFGDDTLRDARFAEWAGQMVEYIASALAADDRKYLRCMPAAMGLILNYYARTRSIEYGDLKELIERLTVHSYKNVLANKYAFQRHHRIFKGRGIEEVYNDLAKNPLLVDPLRQLDMSPFNDGAGALLISRHRELRMLDHGSSRADVALTACAIAQDTLELTQRKRLDSFPATKLAAKRAYAEAGLDLQDWQNKLAPLILEHHDAFVPLTLMNLEDLQLFADHKEVMSFLKNTVLTNGESPLWLNPSGGLLEGHPFAGTAIIKLAECFARLTRKKPFMDGSAQYKFNGKLPTTALVQSFGGIGANVGVAVLDKCDDRTGELQRERSVTHYSNLGTHVIEEKGVMPRIPPRDGKIISVARIAMPYLTYGTDFKRRFALDDQEPVKVVVALVETYQGRFYAFAPRDSAEAKLRPEEICKKDILVDLHDAGGFPTFSIRERNPKSSFLLRKVA
jgi:acetyl-CoA acetyltransferase